ncbi:hypothetical protein C8F01DRAFT_1118887 [Mycena amicta]|nr:hypothetical protein C8F01DRAFT_1118887 [Mycena amicta]
MAYFCAYTTASLRLVFSCGTTVARRSGRNPCVKRLERSETTTICHSNSPPLCAGTLQLVSEYSRASLSFERRVWERKFNCNTRGTTMLFNNTWSCPREV